MVKEGLFHFVRMWFYGAFYENEWYIVRECRYYAEECEAKIMALIDEEPYTENGEWNDQIFAVLTEFNEQVDYGKATLMLSELTGKSLDQFKDYREVGAFVQQLAKEQVPKRLVKQLPISVNLLDNPGWWLIRSRR